MNANDIISQIRDYRNAGRFVEACRVVALIKDDEVYETVIANYPKDYKDGADVMKAIFGTPTTATRLTL